MNVRKSRWSKVYESSEEELVAFLQVRSVMATRRTADPFEQITGEALTKDMDMYLAEGSATFTVAAQAYSMQPGDVIHLPTGTALTSIAGGMAGCVYYEAQ